MTNPNPGLITDPMWNLWLRAAIVIPGVKLSGIYANKKGYHNTVNANLKNWPDNYSIKLPLDLVSYSRTKARAIDLTMSDSEMVKWTSRMRDAAMSHDTRMKAVKEFYGTLDNKTVFGLSKNSINGDWRTVSADKTHLWHGHTSIFTAYVDDWKSLLPLVSVWAGQSYTDWSNNVSLPIKSDTGEEVRYWQNLHNEVRSMVTPAAPELKVDGVYGDASSAAFLDFWKKAGGGTGSTYNGSYISGWLALQYDKFLIKKTSSATPIDPVQLEAMVDKWLGANVPKNLVLNGQIQGSVSIVGGELHT